MQYTFLQYCHWRNYLHRWFGLCIVKTGSCADPNQKIAIMSLADHTFTDLQDRHTEIYLKFLHDIELSDAEILAFQPSVATQSDQHSFIE